MARMEDQFDMSGSFSFMIDFDGQVTDDETCPAGANEWA